MSILSDRQIQQLIQRGKLIHGALDDRVFACAYEFRPGVIALTGNANAHSCAKDWTVQTSLTDIHYIQPGELTWIRTLEEVDIPQDMCAFWWQTNRLSRQGLMLVNMTMVEPGYRGSLSCLFVNFGNKAVAIQPDTVVSKLIFHELGKPARRPSGQQLDRLAYDRGMLMAAQAAPRTFLDIGDLEISLNAKKDVAILEMREQLEILKKELATESESVRASTRTQLEADWKSVGRRFLGVAALAFALVVLAMSWVPWIQATIQPNLTGKIQLQVDHALTQRLVGTSQVDDVRQLRRELEQLQAQIQAASQNGGGR